MKNEIIKKYLVLFLLGFVAKSIYLLPYIRQQYYDALIDATGTTNAQLGLLMGIYGLINMILYLPSGWAADKFSARKLITFSLIITGITGFYYATFPSFAMIMALHALWAVTTVFTFWSAVIKIVHALGPSGEQGKLFGLWQVGKALGATILGFISIPIFSGFGEGVVGLQATIIFYSSVNIIFGVICWFVLKDENLIEIGSKSTFESAEDEKILEENKFTIADMKKILKMPRMWIAGIMVLCLYSIGIGSGMMVPFLTEIMELSETNAALVGTFSISILFLLGGLVATFFSDKFSSKTKYALFGLIGLILTCGIYLLIPGDPAYLVIFLINILVAGLIYYCAYSSVFALIDEFNISKKLSGTAAGLLSFLCYFPEIYGYSTVGALVDNYPGLLGYRLVFGFMIVNAIIGTIAALVLIKMNKKAKTHTSPTVEIPKRM
ncbi:hypothetical protein NEF87_004687 [Candidatus Lokiarchaeum ossiferum]|uniref:MFS transporter n=1 Tax=Candidatus Lokiarchaeum ossiferum TaxID=2951803 RepID=A0ABY6HZU9_9ARCH|nr:hypothetical protein NEF87_004687 [Candidatus Lokiarchaeum sp. B-35]